MQAGRKQHLVNLLLSVVIFLITFPRFVPDYGTGLDPSYVWAFNFLINHDFLVLTGLSYPIGPFGFLKYAAAYQHNLAISLLFFSAVKVSFIFLLVIFSQANKPIGSIVSFLLTLCVASFAGIDFSIIGTTVLLLLLYNRHKKGVYYFVLAVFVALAGLFIKSSIGLASFSAIFAFLLLNLLRRRFTLARTLVLVLFSAVIFLLSGYLLYGGMKNYFAFLNGLLHLAGGYAEGLALYPENNWWLLGGFILTVSLSPFIFKTGEFKLAFWLLLLPLFAMWKHAMGREDSSHAQLLVGFLVIYWSILFFSITKRKVLLFVFALLSITFYYLNLSHIPGFKGITPQMNGLANFKETVIHYNSFNSTYDSISRQNIRSNELDKPTLSHIGNASLDVYPWDLSYIPANNFTWKPRKTLELGASTSAWLSHLAAANYSGDAAPQFVLFHLENDRWGGRLGSLDGRYILNDEPLVISNLLNNYRIQSKTGKYLLLEKRDEHSALSQEKSNGITVTWNEWIPVPEAKEGIVRAAFSNEKSLAGHLKTFLYKGEACFIDYKFEDGKVFSYRFLSSNAVDGLWINPFVLRPDKNYGNQEVVEIRFRNSDTRMVSKKIGLTWQILTFHDGEHPLSWFGKSASYAAEVLFKLKEDFESGGTKGKISTDSYQGEFAEMIMASQFSTTFELVLDTLWDEEHSELMLQLEVFYKNVTPADGKASLVLTLDNSGDNTWLSIPLRGNGIPDEWTYACLNTALFPEVHQGAKIKAYVWNNGSGALIIDNLSLIISN